MAWAPDYALVDDLAGFVGVPDDAEDTELALAIAAASRAIDRCCNRQFGNAAGARYYTPQWWPRVRRWAIDIDDLFVTDGLFVMADHGDAGTYDQPILDYALKPVNAQADGDPWTQLVVSPASPVQPQSVADSVEVTAAPWGWETVPDTIKEATLLQASRLFTRRKAPFGIAGSPADGSELRLLAKVDPDVAVIVSAYTRWWAVK